MFSSDKILHEIIFLLSLSDNKMNLLKLMKELYLSDRASIDNRDVSISGDIFYSMPHGPVLSGSLNMLYDLNNNNWGDFLLSIPSSYYPDIQLKKYTEPVLLSKKDKEYLQNTYTQFKNYTPKQLEDYTHNLPEWVDPKGSSVKIRFQDIAFALGKSDEEIKEAKEEYEISNQLRSFGI